MLLTDSVCVWIISKSENTIFSSFNLWKWSGMGVNEKGRLIAEPVRKLFHKISMILYPPYPVIPCRRDEIWRDVTSLHISWKDDISLLIWRRVGTLPSWKMKGWYPPFIKYEGTTPYFQLFTPKVVLQCFLSTKEI